MRGTLFCSSDNGYPHYIILLDLERIMVFFLNDPYAFSISLEYILLSIVLINRKNLLFALFSIFKRL